MTSESRAKFWSVSERRRIEQRRCGVEDFWGGKADGLGGETDFSNLGKKNKRMGRNDGSENVLGIN